MKLIIVLKKTDAEGLGGEILRSMGMKQSRKDPGAFAKQFNSPSIETTHDSDVHKHLEALMDYGIRPMRVFQRDNSTAGLTPIHASACEPSPLEQAVDQISAAIKLLSK